MYSEHNPYAPPASQFVPPSWWQRIKQLLTPPSHAEFARGRPMICDGVLFYLNPADKEWLTAALPSTELTQARMNLLVDEALHALPLFLLDFPGVRGKISGRKLRITMISSYQMYPQSIFPDVELDEVPIAAALRFVEDAEKKQSPSNIGE